MDLTVCPCVIKGMKEEMNGVHPEYLIAPPNIPKAKNKKVIEEVKK